MYAVAKLNQVYAFSLLILLFLISVGCQQGGSNGVAGADGNDGRVFVYDGNGYKLGALFSGVSGTGGYTCIIPSPKGIYCFSPNGYFSGVPDSQMYFTGGTNGCFYTNGSCSGPCYLSADTLRYAITQGNAYRFYRVSGAETVQTNVTMQTAWNGSSCTAINQTMAKAITPDEITMPTQYNVIQLPVYMDWQ